jgi:hypothetical protein
VGSHGHGREVVPADETGHLDEEPAGWVAEPVSVYIDTHGTGRVDEVKLAEAVRKNFELTPKGIIEALDLRRF